MALGTMLLSVTLNHARELLLCGFVCRSYLFATNSADSLSGDITNIYSHETETLFSGSLAARRNENPQYGALIVYSS